MKFWMFVVGVVILFVSLPYIRCFFKRLNCSIKIKNVCNEKGYTFHKNHVLWFLGGKNGKQCECYIETDKEVLSIKLFGVSKKRRVLVFLENGGYFLRRFVYVELRIQYAFDGKVKEFPTCDFDYECEVLTEGKPIRKVLLMNPVPMEMRMQARNSKETIISPGDKVYDLEIYNLSGLLKELREVKSC